MNQETFQIFLWVMSAVALAVFIALYFVKAGYGMFRTASWGISINNKLAWVLMEAPVFIVMFGLWGKSGAGFSIPVYLFFLLFQLHYLQRAFVFPFLLKGKSRMPVAIMAMGIVFNLERDDAGGRFVLFRSRRLVCRWLGLFAETSCLVGNHSVFCRYVRQFAFRLCDTSSAQAR